MRSGLDLVGLAGRGARPTDQISQWRRGRLIAWWHSAVERKRPEFVPHGNRDVLRASHRIGRRRPRSHTCARRRGLKRPHSSTGARIVGVDLTVR